MSTVHTSPVETLPVQPAAHPRSALGRLMHSYAELTKARLSALVVFTTAVGFIAASPAGTVDWFTLLCTVLGTSLAAGAANALNEVWEVDRDARMLRTRRRPLPSGELSRVHGFILAIVMAFAGLSILLLGANILAAGLTLLTVVVYVLIYTPLKVRTTLNTLVGAVVGALPPMIGWVAATGSLESGAWLLAMLLFIWQLPHFLALAWMYRDDYERGGFRMLPIIDPTGRLTCQMILATSLLLVPFGILAGVNGIATPVFVMGATIGGLVMLGLALQMTLHFNTRSARRVFIGSIMYLPIVLALLMVDARLIVTHLPGSLAYQKAAAAGRIVDSSIAAGTRDRVAPPPPPFVSQPDS